MKRLSSPIHSTTMSYTSCRSQLGYVPDNGSTVPTNNSLITTRGYSGATGTGFNVPGFVGPPQDGYTTNANTNETYEQQPSNTMLYVVGGIAVGALIYFAMK
jgi:hypothetical protein